MKHYFDENGKEFTTPPDPYKGRSPMHNSDGTYNDDAFRAMGGVIVEDEKLTPEDKLRLALDYYLGKLKKQVEDLALDITVEEFKSAAGSMMSPELVAWAKSKGVPDSMIDVVRPQILAFVADASRLGLTWNDIFPKQPSK